MALVLAHPDTHSTKPVVAPPTFTLRILLNISSPSAAAETARGVVTRRCHQLAASAAPAYPPNFNTNDLPPTCMKFQTKKHFVLRISERDF